MARRGPNYKLRAKNKMRKSVGIPAKGQAKRNLKRKIDPNYGKKKVGVEKFIKDTNKSLKTLKRLIKMFD